MPYKRRGGKETGSLIRHLQWCGCTQKDIGSLSSEWQEDRNQGVRNNNAGTAGMRRMAAKQRMRDGGHGEYGIVLEAAV